MLKRLLLVILIALLIVLSITTIVVKVVGMISTFFTTTDNESQSTANEEISDVPTATEPTSPQSIETEPIETQPAETEFVYVEQFPEVPLYNQLDYPKTKYGHDGSTVRSSGCGIASYAMVLSYLLDREILPDELAGMYHRYKVEGGSSHSLFTKTQDDWGITLEDNCYWIEAWVDGKVMKALENGQPIIANVHEDSAFTIGGHFIVLYGLTEDGKILVRDPNGANYNKKGFLAEGFQNGFDPNYFREHSVNYFIYQAKDLDALATQAQILNSAPA